MDSNGDQEKPEFISYKKVLLFGAEFTGKSSFVKRIKSEEFQEHMDHTKDGKSILYY